MKILAIDDDETILELLRAALTSLGYEDAHFASSAKDARRMITDQRQPFDCILLDIQMPDVDGIELCSEIRSTPGYSRVPIIMVTAMSDRSYVDRAFAAGASDYVTKPFDVLELGTRLGLANSLTYERGLVTDGLNAVRALQEELTDGTAHSLGEPIEICGVPRTIGYLAFENYLLQLTRICLFQSQVFAVKIADIKEIHADLSPVNFQRLLKSIAGTISENAKFDCNFLSYRGDGVFVCINHNDTRPTHVNLEAVLQSAVGDLGLTTDKGASLNLQLVVGPPVSLGVFTKTGSLNYLRKAVEYSETKCLEFQTRTTEDIAPPDYKTLRQPYESLLQDSLSDGVFATAALARQARHKQLACDAV